MILYSMTSVNIIAIGELVRELMQFCCCKLRLGTVQESRGRGMSFVEASIKQWQ
jgi:hypothetical protein